MLAIFQHTSLKLDFSNNESNVIWILQNAKFHQNGKSDTSKATKKTCLYAVIFLYRKYAIPKSNDCSKFSTTYKLAHEFKTAEISSQNQLYTSLLSQLMYNSTLVKIYEAFTKICKVYRFYFFIITQFYQTQFMEMSLRKFSIKFVKQ